MFTLGRLPLPAIVVPILLAGSLFAQRYPERDHTVFHRTPPAQTKHQLAPGTNARTHAAPATTAANNSAHVAAPANGQSGSYSGASAGSKPGGVTSPDANEHPPQ